MTATRIENPREFFDNVVTPDFQDLNANRSDLRLAYHACTSLLSLRDWVCCEHRGKPWNAQGKAQAPFAKANDLQNALKTLNSDFDIVTDIANASKHMVLDSKRSRTPLWGNANTEVQQIHGGAIGSGPIGAAPIGGSSSRIVVNINQTYHDVFGCIWAVYAAWDKLMQENSW
jgi:hypothetical protein